MNSKSGLVPKQIQDKNGKQTTVWVKPDQGTSADSANTISAAPTVLSSDNDEETAGSTVKEDDGKELSEGEEEIFDLIDRDEDGMWRKDDCDIWMADSPPGTPEFDEHMEDYLSWAEVEGEVEYEINRRGSAPSANFKSSDPKAMAEVGGEAEHENKRIVGIPSVNFKSSDPKAMAQLMTVYWYTPDTGNKPDTINSGRIARKLEESERA